MSSASRAGLAWSVLLVGLVGCGGPPPSAVAPEPEPEAEEEVVVAPEPVRPPEIPIEERVRAPFAVQGEGRFAAREPRRDLVVLERPAAAAPLAAAPRDTARAPAGQAAAGGGARPAAGAPAGTTAGGAARPPAAAPAARAPRQHTVAVGETFFGIARRYEVTPSALAAVNPGVDFDRLRAGQVLQLPAYAVGATGGDAPRAQGSTATPRPTPPATPPARTPAAPAGTATRRHTVAAGETLWSISRRYGVSPEQIRTANRMTGDTVRIGQALVIPGS